MVDKRQAAHGRPEALVDRLEALVAIARSEDIDLTPATVQALAWWEEGIAPILGCHIETAGWRRTEAGPRSAAVEAVTSEWSETGAWSPMENVPIRSACFSLSADLIARGEQWSGVAPVTLQTAPSDCRPWYQMMNGFMQGFFASDRGENVQPWSGGRDIEWMLLSDPTYASSEWEEAGGPALVRVTAPDDSGLSEFTGNGFGYAMTFLMTHVDTETGRPAAQDFFQAAWLLARLLVNRAAADHPNFGGRGFLATRGRLKAVEEESASGVVSARFSLDGVQVASASWQPRKIVKEMTGRTGKVWTTSVDDGSLLALEVDAQHRRQGIGTYVLRHALSRGCVHAPAPTPEAFVLWEQHGWPLAEGGWRMERVAWPLCATETVVKETA